MSGISIKVFNSKRIWRFQVDWNKSETQIFWLKDWQYCPNRCVWDYTTLVPLSLAIKRLFSL